MLICSSFVWKMYDLICSRWCTLIYFLLISAIYVASDSSKRRLKAAVIGNVLLLFIYFCLL
jgi:hypothetical protein